MARSYQEILEKVMPLAGRDPGRFKRFYDRVTELLLRIPEGGSIIVSEHCTARSLELFMDVAEMCIIEELFHKTTRALMTHCWSFLMTGVRSGVVRPGGLRSLTGISTRIEMYDISQFISL